MIGIFSPILKYTGYGLTWRNAAVMMWSGLRGAVGLALALVVNQDPHFGVQLKTKVANHTMITARKILFYQFQTSKDLRRFD